MAPESSRVIVATNGATPTTCVHHRDFPEIRADGESPTVAANHLIEQLTRALDSALTQWRRENIEQAIADIRAFLAQHS